MMSESRKILGQTMLDRKKYHLNGKIYIRASFELASPLLIGSGESEHSDIDVIRDEPFNGQAQPVIPATSIIGVFRHLFDPLLELETDSQMLNAVYEFFGVTDDEKNVVLKQERFSQKSQEWDLNQSAVFMSDIVLADFPITQRDSVRIDPRRGTAADEAKFDYEIVEPSPDDGKNSIDMVFEIDLRENSKQDYREHFKSFVGYFLQAIQDGRVRFGGKTNKGFGVLKLKPGSIAVAELDLAKPGDVKQWLTNTPVYSNKAVPSQPDSRNLEANDLIGDVQFNLPTKYFEISAEFRIKNSLLVRAYSTDPAAPDVSHIQRGEDYILPGTSIMGAIRHRAWKIINTMFQNDKEKARAFYNLFGFAKEPYPEAPQDLKDQYEQKAAKGRVLVDEAVIRGKGANFIDQVQTRIKIDRFTGGTIAGALLQEKALWQTNDESTITLNIKIKDYKDWEAGLFLFILKDLVTGDLPIGGEKSIGRGVLIGKKATISWTEEAATATKTVDLTFDENGFVEEQERLGELDDFVQAWRNKMDQKLGEAA